MPAPPLIFSRAAVRELDRRAIEDYRIPGIVLMENAARGAAQLAITELERIDSLHHPVLLIAGGGNNGGDAFAIARHLHNAAIPTRTVALKPADAYTGDAATNLAILQAMRLPFVHADPRDPVAALDAAFNADATRPALIIDGILGTGLTGDVRAPFDRVIRWINERDAAVLSIDIPSGLDADTGAELGVAVRADLTATFVGFKRGFVTAEGQCVIGRVAVVDIGAPRELVAELGESPRR